VRSATFSRHALINDGRGGSDVYIPGYVPTQGEKGGASDVYTHYVGSRFVETFRIPLLLGRTIGDGDIEGAPKIALVNSVFARRYLAGSNPIGRRFGFDAAKNA
jgi:hypothetical protein